jgi:DedD protein
VPVEPPTAPRIEVNLPPVVEAKPEAVLENRQKIPLTAANPKTPLARAPAPSAPSPSPESAVDAAPSSVQPAPRTTVPVEPVTAKPSARILEAKPAAAVTAPVVSRLFSGFLLQAGVFSSVQRAEELHARLTLSGVPSSLETRVQVGPFKNKQEAEAAQAKLRELGVETILVPPKGKN